jgi:S-adenosyl methyltransferase
MVAVLHFVRREDDPHGLVRAYSSHLPAGSHLAIAHAAREGQEQWEHLYDETSNPVTLRDKAEFTGFFDGFDIVEPGVVWAGDSPRHEPKESVSARFGNWAAVARKP